MKRRAVSSRVVFAGFFGLILAALAVGGLLYFGKFRYEPRASGHVPRDAVVIGRLSVERVGLFDPARNHLMPFVDSIAAPASGPSRRERIKSKTKSEFNVDVREVVVAAGPSASDWVVVVGGMFPREPWLEQVVEVLNQEGVKGAADGGVWSAASGTVHLAQAKDGSVIAASSRARAQAALLGGGAAPGRGDVDVTATEKGVALLRQWGLAPGAWSSVRSLSARAAATGADVRLRLADGIPPAQREELMAQLKAVGGEDVRAEGPEIHARLEREALNRVAAHLAAWLKPRVGIAGPDPSQVQAR